MKCFIITGNENNINNFLDNACWGEIWNISKNVITYNRTSNTEIKLNFGPSKSSIFDILQEQQNEKIKSKLTEECKKFDLSLKDN